MESLYEQVKGGLRAYLQKASHAKRLQNHNLEKDIDFCLELNQFNSVVFLSEDGLKNKNG